MMQATGVSASLPARKMVVKAGASSAENSSGETSGGAAPGFVNGGLKSERREPCAEPGLVFAEKRENIPDHFAVVHQLHQYGFEPKQSHGN